MRHNHTIPSRAERERLLDGRPVPDSALSELISSARAPGEASELAGLTPAVVAFRTAPAPAGLTDERSPSMLRSLASKVIATKVLAAAAGAAAIGGVALAATTHQSSEPTTGATGSTAATAPSGSDSRPGGSDASMISAPESTDANSGAHAAGTPSPSLTGLCNAWLAHERNHGSAGKSADSAAFTVLIRAAGGQSAVDGYCTTLLATSTPSHASGRPSDVPSHSHPAGKPSDVASHSHPAGEPTGVPSHTHPAGKPSH